MTIENSSIFTIQKSDSINRVIGLFAGGFTGDRWISRTEGPVTRKMFPFDDAIMIYHSWSPSFQSFGKAHDVCF